MSDRDDYLAQAGHYLDRARDLHPAQAARHGYHLAGIHAGILALLAPAQGGEAPAPAEPEAPAPAAGEQPERPKTTQRKKTTQRRRAQTTKEKDA